MLAIASGAVKLKDPRKTINHEPCDVGVWSQHVAFIKKLHHHEYLELATTPESQNKRRD